MRYSYKKISFLYTNAMQECVVEGVRGAGSLNEAGNSIHALLECDSTISSWF